MVAFVHNILPVIIALIELIGIIIITVACLKAFYEYIRCSIYKKSVETLRHNLGISMVIGLEFKMAAEILRTLLVREFSEILILGGIIILRALLTYLIKMDIREECGECDKHKNLWVK